MGLGTNKGPDYNIWFLKFSENAHMKSRRLLLSSLGDSP